MADTTESQNHFIRSWVPPFVLIILSNLLGYLHLLPVFPQLLINSSACVYIGVILSSKLRRNGDNLTAADKEKDAESIGHKEALRFPIFASIFLFGFYLVYKYISKDLVNTLITLQFCLATIISTSNLLEGLIPFPQAMRKADRTPLGLSLLVILLVGGLAGTPGVLAVDNVRSMQVDCTCKGDDLATLGIRATGLKAIAPDYLGARGKQRRFGRFRSFAARD